MKQILGRLALLTVFMTQGASTAFGFLDQPAANQAGPANSAGSSGAGSGSSSMASSGSQAEDKNGLAVAMGVVSAGLLGAQSAQAFGASAKAYSAGQAHATTGEGYVAEANMHFGAAATMASSPASAGGAAAEAALGDAAIVKSDAEFALATESNSAGLVQKGMGILYGSMAALTMAQTFQHKKTGTEATNFNCQVSGGTSCNAKVPDDWYNDPSKLLDPNSPYARDPNVKDLGKNLQALKQKGITVDPQLKKVVANGKVVENLNDAIAAAQAAAGGKLSQGDIDKFKADFDKLTKEAIDKMAKGNPNASDSFDEGGGPLDIPGLGSGKSDPKANLVGSKMAGLGIGRDPAGVKGMTKMFNGEPIGVAGDSIFEMMNRRYLLLDKQDTLLSAPVPQNSK